jgi:hypothetical protein
VMRRLIIAVVLGVGAMLAAVAPALAGPIGPTP